MGIKAGGKTKKEDTQKTSALNNIPAKTLQKDKRERHAGDVENLKKEIFFNKRSALYGRRKVIAAGLLIFLTVSLIFSGGVLLVLSFIEENSMRITVNRGYLDVLSVYDNRDFNNPTTAMSIKGPSKMDNITYLWLPQHLDQSDGSHNGENYIAFTFYLKNNGRQDVYYLSEIVLNKVSKDLDAAMRIMLIQNGETRTYAKAKADGGAEMVSNDPKALTVPFLGETQVMKGEERALAVGEHDKYTVVIWLEGEDSDCVNKVLGGTVSVEMRFEAVKTKT